MPVPGQRPAIGAGGAFGKPGGKGVSEQRTNRPFSDDWKPTMKAPRELSSPFPFYGGKSKIAPLVWERLGNPTVYVEPFAGSLACLLARPTGGGPREIVCDLDGGIANFWRAVEADAEEVAAWADYPTNHHDLTARHKWLKAWFAENSWRLSEDPHFYDAKVAGWWVWGISLWIGGGWCSPNTPTSDSRPHCWQSWLGATWRCWRVATTDNDARRQGVRQTPARLCTQGRREVMAYRRKGWKRPAARCLTRYRTSDPKGSGQGVSAQRKNLPATPDQIPWVNATHRRARRQRPTQPHAGPDTARS